MTNPIARIPAAQFSIVAPDGTPSRVLGRQEKAAIIVRLLLAEGVRLPLSSMPDHMQAALTERMGSLRLVDRGTLRMVIEEFVQELESVGLAFPGGLDGALSILDGHISASAASRLRRMAGNSGKIDAWERIVPLPADRLLQVLEDESVEVAAVLLSKLPVTKAAELLGRLPGDRARRVAHAVSLTGNVDPETVRRIGAALVGQLDSQPPKAFDTSPVERVGAILNVTSAATRDALLDGLDADDAEFAMKVRKAIFTFVHIPARVPSREIPKVIRTVDQPVLVTALAGARDRLAPVAEFILANMSQRMAQGLREEIAERGKVSDKDAEEAQSAIVEAVRELEAAGELQLVTSED